MFCPKCGFDLGDEKGLKFCPQCGGMLSQEQEEKLTGKRSRKGLSNRGRIIAMAAAGILAAGGLYLATHAKCRLVIKNNECVVREGIFEHRWEMTGHVVVPEGATRIKPYTFIGCSSLSSIELPSGVTSIGDSAFYGCSSLSSLTIPAHLDVDFAGIPSSCQIITY